MANSLQEESDHNRSSSLPPWVGIVIRVYLVVTYPYLTELLDSRVEVSTTISSVKQCNIRLISVQEGLFLFKNGIPCYTGGVFHQAPLFLVLFSYLPKILTPYLFILADYVISRAMTTFATFKVQEQKDEQWPEPIEASDEDDKMIGEYDEKLEECMIPNIQTKPFKDPLEDPTLIPKDPTKPIDQLISPQDIGSIYLLNPLSILACVAQSTQIFSNLGVALALMFAARGQRAASMLSLSFAAYFTMYPLVLIGPCVLLIEKATKESWRDIVIKCILNMVLYLGGLLFISFLLMGDWSFINATYGMMIFADNLRPNVGLFWYFYMEVFNQFRTFFISIFHLNTVIFTIPICMYFRDRPLFASFLICAFISIFKSYPTIADSALVLPLLMMHSELFKYAPHLYLGVSGILYSVVLGPLMFNAWVYAGSGNANFFYAITLIWAISQVILLIDIVFAFLKRDWERKNPGWRKMRPELIYEY